MSRGDDLRRLAAQLTALAELEESIAHGLSRVMGSAGSGGSAASTASAAATASPAASSTPLRERSGQVAATALLRAAGARSRSRSPAPIPKRAPRRSSSVATVARGSVALAESGLVTGLAVKSCPPVPPAQLRLSRVSRALQAASSTPRPSGDVPDASARPARASEAPCVPDVASDSDSDWDALLDAHGLTPLSLQPPSPSRLTPLVLVGVLATSAAVACARPPSAPCGAIFERSPRDCSALRHRSVRWGRLLLVLSSGSWQLVALLRVLGHADTGSHVRHSGLLETALEDSVDPLVYLFNSSHHSLSSLVGLL